MKSKTIKISVNLPEKIVNAIREKSKRDDITMTEVIRLAVSMQKWFDDQVAAGSKILIETQGKQYHVVRMP